MFLFCSVLFLANRFFGWKSQEIDVLVELQKVAQVLKSSEGELILLLMEESK